MNHTNRQLSTKFPIPGLSRIAALYTNYHGPMRILRDLPPSPEGAELTVCFGKEWHRSPSSFHLPDGYSVRFIPSEFNGQLPAPYADSHNGEFTLTHVGDDELYV